MWMWGLFAGAVVLLVLAFALPRNTGNGLDLTDFTAALRRGEVAEARISAQNGTLALSGRLRDGQEYQTRTLASDPVVKLDALQAAGVNVSYLPPARLSVLGVLSILLTLALIVGLVIVLLRSRQGSGTDAAGTFGKSKAAVIAEGQILSLIHI